MKAIDTEMNINLAKVFKCVNGRGLEIYRGIFYSGKCFFMAFQGLYTQRYQPL